jgi:hypothetical protein
VRADAIEFYGRLPFESMRAVTVTMDGVPVGIIGVAKDAHVARLFSEYRAELRPWLRSITVLRAIKRAMEIVAEYPKVYAVAEHSEGERVLSRLGFVRQGEVYTWQG